MPRSISVVVVLMGVVGVLREGSISGEQQLQEYAIDVSSSTLYVVTHKEGLLSFLGHEHAIVPTEWTGTLCLADPVPAGARGSLILRTASLVIDSDSARTRAGLGSGPSASDVRDIQRKMLDADHLAADSFPEIRLDVVAVQAEADGRVQARATVLLHGISRDADLTVTVEPRPQGGILLQGRLTIRQTDFGIRPETVAGVVKVSDPVDLHFGLVAEPTGRPCG